MKRYTEEALKELLKEHLYAPDTMKIKKWEDLAKRTRKAIE